MFYAKTEFTPERDAEIIRLVGEGRSREQIARAMGLPVKPVRQRAKELSLKYAPRATHWSPEDDARLKELVDSGCSQAEASRVMGKTKNSVAGRAFRLGWQWTSQPAAGGWKAQPNREVQKMALPTNAGCQYIYGETKGIHTEFCGKPRHVRRVFASGRWEERTSSWCTEHYAKCHVTFTVMSNEKEAA